MQHQESGISSNIPSLRRDFVRKLHEILFSLNFAFLLGVGILQFAFRQLVFAFRTQPAVHDFNYGFLRMAVRVNDFFHLSSSQASIRFPNPGSQVGMEVAFLLPVLSMAGILYLLVRLSTGSVVFRLMLRAAGGIIAILGLPGFYLFDLRYSVGPSQRASLWGPAADPLFVFFVAELAGLAVLLLAARWRPLSLWATGFLAVLHYGFWVSVLQRDLANFGAYPLYRLYGPYITLLLFPLSGFVWLVYLRVVRAEDSETVSVQHIGKATLISVAAAVVLLVVLLMPGRGYSLENARDRKTLAIEMLRPGCFGSCPVYELTIHGDGLVKYSGKQSVKECGSRTTQLSKDQVDKILREFDRVRFFAIEDRAFLWNYDTPKVWVSISIDGKTKRVGSDTYQVGSGWGVEAQFVRAAANIESIVGTERWVYGGGYCRESNQPASK